MRVLRRWVLWSLVVVLAAGCVSTAPTPALARNHARETVATTALDRYVAKPDPNFEYDLLHTIDGDGWTGYVLHMVSQQWRTADEVDRPIWEHWLTIVCPDDVRSDTAMMLVGGGNNKSKPPRGADVNLRTVAMATHSVAATVQIVPNEPLRFADRDYTLNEDGIIAYTWEKYLRTGDEEWPLRLPMTKAVVRAMDTVQEFCASRKGGRHEIESFVVAGGSKRGWTTWTTAAVDNRVVACVPIVIDLLNVQQSFKHHYEVYGDWAPAIRDYTKLGLMDWMGSKEYAALMDIVDPYSYRDRLTMPKLIVNAGSDQFFVPTSSQFYIDDLKGPTYLSYVPNQGHGGCGEDGMGSLAAFHGFVVTQTPLPTYHWEFPDDNTIRVTTPSATTAVQLWQVTNPKARDFRVDVVGKAWTPTNLEDRGGGVFEAHVETPPEGWTAFLIQLSFASPTNMALKCSSPVRVVPNTLPYTFTWPEHPEGGFLSGK
ncbi:MAG TPA: PhoPQ-activated pathogenicity-related family protein [Candidatus Hydrogenedentes bacterium]|nr:PhoPQ-activated pathogenicity-related family protein [Candidatus Hydrogenedentota bacterium]HPG65697.1 PhoPQ-activated pathogenicity-related family protein [Candidatus Hydrogenedentota bacterium]